VSTHFPFPDIVDNTLLSAFRRCETFGYYSGIRRIRSHEESTHLIAGGAFARGLEITRKSFFESGKSFADSLVNGVEALILEYGEHEPHPKIAQKGVSNMIAALDYYFRVWPIDKQLVPYKLANGKHAIEFSFCLPTNVMHPISGDPIMYAGKFDMIGVHDNNQLFVTDEKTSTQLGEYWMQRWRMSNQMTGYVWAARMHGIPVKGAWIRGIGILSRSLTSANVPTFRPQWRIDAWYHNMELTLHKMIVAWRNGLYQQNLDSACSSYGGCTFMNLCEVQNPEEWIPINYFPNTWSPLNSRD
jgi:hypothetical protein